MKKVVFVILHYIVEEITINCIESIINNLDYENFNIVVVDNGSTNKSGINLENKYKKNNKIKVIKVPHNLGFSKGNNVGYSYAKNILKTDFIVVINNDTEMIQNNFATVLSELYDEKKYYVLGPDIVNIDGIHQSPQRDHIITKGELRNWYLKRKLFDIYLNLYKKGFFIFNNRIIDLYIKNKNKRQNKYNYIEEQENVELQGACFIFSPSFINKNERAFEELSFMYGEEAIMAYICSINKWKIMYSPKIRILHLENISTFANNKNYLDKELFYSKHHVIALKNFKHFMRKLK